MILHLIFQAALYNGYGIDSTIAFQNSSTERWSALSRSPAWGPLVASLLSGRLAQMARALPSHGRGHWFESSIAHRCSHRAVMPDSRHRDWTATDPEPFLP